MKSKIFLFSIFSLLSWSAFGQYANCTIASSHLISITSAHYHATSQTTCGKGNTYNISNITNYCGDPLYMYGAENLYAVTFGSSGYTVISIDSASSVYGSISLYHGCPNIGTCQGNTTTIGTSKSVQAYVVSGTTYYVMISEWPDSTRDTCFTYNINITSPGASSGTVPPDNQDCIDAIPVCQPIYYQSNAYIGQGNIQNEINDSLGHSCLASGELNDVWYSFSVQRSGNLSFLITPNNLANDYDWSVFNLTNAKCSDIYTNTSLEVSCNYSETTGPTGPNGGSSNSTQGAGGTPYNKVIPVHAGETYVINVSNFNYSQSGYTIDFSASTAVIYDNTPPALSSSVIPATCPMNTLNVNFSENVLTNNLTAADFTLTSSTGTVYTVSSITGTSITAGAPYGKTFQLGFSPAIQSPGNYTLNLVGYLADLCGNVSIPQSIPVTLTYASPSSFGISSNFGTYCNVKSYVLLAPASLSSYVWTFNGAVISGSTTNTITITEPGIYSVSANNTGCYEIAAPIIIN